jgi:hypothetical protein
MNEENVDQVQDETPATEQPAEQSETTESSEQAVVESKLYKLPDGREVTADDLYREHTENLLPEFTRRSQKLADYERRMAETESRNKRTAEESIAQSPLLEDVDPTVRDAIVQIVSPEIQKALELRDKQEEEKRNQEAFDKRLNELEKKYPGKFKKVEILTAMQDPSNEIYDPEVLFQKLHWDEYLDSQIKAAMKGKSSTASTENTSGEAPRKPGEIKTPTTWAEAARNATSRL